MDPTNLQNLHDIITPAYPPWLPPAPGWYALGVSILLLSGWFVIEKFFSWRRNKYRRDALVELKKLDEKLREPADYKIVLPLLPILVKRTAIAAYGREPVAAVSGNDWLEFLDRTGGAKLFSKGGGQLLNDCSFLPANQLSSLSSEQVDGLLKAAEYWIHKHRLDQYSK